MNIHPFLLNESECLSQLQQDALAVFGHAVQSANPYDSTCKALQKETNRQFRFVLSIGKAAVPMMQAAYDTFGTDGIQEAVLVTKYEHLGSFSAPNCVCFEAGHPVSDENSRKAAEYVLAGTGSLCETDVCLVLISGGGSALFESSLIDARQQQQVTERLLKSGADIYELNCVRKRLSAVKGGKLAAHMQPATVRTYALSDVPGSRPDVIASGPTQQDPVSDETFRTIIEKYSLNDGGIFDTLPPKVNLPENPHFCIVGDVKMLCDAAAEEAEKRGYQTVHCGTDLSGDAEEATVKALQTAIACARSKSGKTAFIIGGETTVTVRGNGKGGRSQQAALRAAIELQNTQNIVFLAGGSDGTDGPTDAAGGLADGCTVQRMHERGIDASSALANNDAYTALRAGNALLMTGPTGTNVNDLILILIQA